MYAQILKNVSRFIDLTMEETSLFTSLLKTRKLRKRQYLVQEGDVALYECYVHKGILKSYYLNKEGQEHILHFAMEDWWVTDMQSFLEQKPARFNVEAIEDCELLLIDLNALNALFEQVPKFERFFRILYERSLLSMQNRILASLSMTAEERYNDFRQRYPAFDQRLPQYMIASYLGITPEFLSRIRKQISNNGS